MDGLTRGFVKSDPGMVQALSGELGTQDATPIFVVGLPRSGSSLIEQIIASHPKAFGAGALPGFLCTAHGISYVAEALVSTGGHRVLLQLMLTVR